MNTDLVKHLSVFLGEYLPRDCGFSPHTVETVKEFDFSQLNGFTLFLKSRLF